MLRLEPSDFRPAHENQADFDHPRKNQVNFDPHTKINSISIQHIERSLFRPHHWNFDPPPISSRLRCPDTKTDCFASRHKKKTRFLTPHENQVNSERDTEIESISTTHTTIKSISSLYLNQVKLHSSHWNQFNLDHSHKNQDTFDYHTRTKWFPARI